MGMNNIQNIDMQNNQKWVIMKKFPDRINVDMQEDNFKKVKLERINYHSEKEQQNNNIEIKQYGTAYISYTIEKDLNIVIANIIDSKTNEKIRQVPPEENIRIKKLLRAYQDSFSPGGKLLNSIAQ
ncbi:MAG: flagellar protein FlaG [Candidatus Brocadia sp.]|jgi:uncharacterized FlaG/YvyC family protein